MTRNRTDFTSSVDDPAPAIVDTVASLDRDQAERLTIESILEHRRLLDIAQVSYEALMAAQKHRRGSQQLQHAYKLAMIEHEAKMAVVATLIEQLGYIPNVPGEGS